MSAVDLRNLTRHDIVLYLADGQSLLIHPEGVEARVETTEKKIVDMALFDQPYSERIPVYRRSFGKVVGLPEPQENVVFLVSSMVLSAAVGRNDVCAPDTGPTAVRNEMGDIVAVTRLIAAS